MINEDKMVNVSKVAKACLSIGQFGLFHVEDVNLVSTHWFTLNVTDEQFWKIQCKLEAKQKNVWLYKGKDGLQECAGEAPKTVYDSYCSMIDDWTTAINRTYLTLGNVEVFTDETKYIGVPARYLDMIDYSPSVKKGNGSGIVIVDEIHLFTTMQGNDTECKYLRPLTADGFSS